MSKTRFHQLCSAYNQAQDNFENYRKECHQFSIELVENLKKYYEIPPAQFSLYKITNEGGYDLVPDALIHALRMTPDHFWHFGMGITVCKEPETLPEELILIHLLFRKGNNNDFFIKYAFTNQEFAVEKGNPDSYIEFFDFLFETIVSSYENHIQEFTEEKTTRKLGFVQDEKSSSN